MKALSEVAQLQSSEAATEDSLDALCFVALESINC